MTEVAGLLDALPQPPDAELAAIRAMLRGVHATNWFDRRLFRHYIPSVMVSLGTVEVLAGNLDEAEGWRVLRAFVASRRTPDDRAAVDGWLAGARPTPKGMFSYLGVAWPEFAAFEGAEL